MVVVTLVAPFGAAVLDELREAIAVALNPTAIAAAYVSDVLYNTGECDV